MTPSFIVSKDLQRVAPEAANVSVFDRGFLFGDSIYEVIRTYHGKLFMAEEHYRRLSESAASLHFEVPFSFAALQEHLCQLVREIDNDNCYLRIIVTRGVSSSTSIDPPESIHANTYIIAKPLPAWDQKLFDQGIRLTVVDIRRNSRFALSPGIKSGNYLNNYLALHEARSKGFDDAIMLNLDDELTESTTSNLFLVKSGEVQTAMCECGILSGITRHVLLSGKLNTNIPIVEARLSMDDLRAADEIFITSTTRGIMPVAWVDQQSYASPGAITHQLRQAFADFVEESCAR